jgi:hypothetical protein
MYAWVLHGMDEGQVGCSREIKPPHALDLRFVKAHCAQEVKQLLPKWRKFLEVRLLPI